MVHPYFVIDILIIISYTITVSWNILAIFNLKKLKYNPNWLFLYEHLYIRLLISYNYSILTTNLKTQPMRGFWHWSLKIQYPLIKRSIIWYMRLFFETPQTHFWTHAFYRQVSINETQYSVLCCFFFKLHVIGCL